MTFFFETYGCQMNHAESASTEQLLLSRSWIKAEGPEAADLVVLNTCSVRITAETRVFGRIAHYCALKKKRSLVLIVMGCMAERLHDELKKKYPKLDYVVGMFERQRFSDIFHAIEVKGFQSDTGNRFIENNVIGNSVFENVMIDERAVNGYFFAPTSYVAGAFQANVPIMNGCNNFCSYCIVPYVRGRELSRKMDEILAELDSLADKGVREITLLGQNVNSYTYFEPSTGQKIDFPELLRQIARHIEKKNSIRWVRFMSSHPKDLSDSLIQVLSQERVFCRQLHLPIQHGSDRILEAMNRKYTRSRYLALVDRIRSLIPDITLTTDILVGFPGETESDIQDTLELLRLVRFEAAFMYHYNPREGTKAFEMPDWIPDDVKKERLARVIELQHRISAEIMRARVGLTVTVLVESTSRNNHQELFGHTELGEMVVFERTLESPDANSANPDLSYIGQFVQATLICLRGRTFRAKIKYDIG